jgi:cell division protein FtsB
VPIDVEKLNKERGDLKARLRELEQDQRKLEAELKKYRQRELQTKRQIEALTTLIEVQEHNDDASVSPEGAKASPPTDG